MPAIRGRRSGLVSYRRRQALFAAHFVFATLISLLAIGALAAGRKYAPDEEMSARPVTLTRTYQELIIENSFPPPRHCAVVDAEDRCRPAYAVPLFRCFSEAVSMNLNHLVLIPFHLARTTRSRFARRMRIRLQAIRRLARCRLSCVCAGRGSPAMRFGLERPSAQR